MEKKNYPALDMQVYRKTLSSGLPVAVIAAPGFTRKVAYLMTDFGAIHTEFSVDGQLKSVPAGVAHYLEHKLFDMPGGRDITAEFAALGASPNAFTGYNSTAYYFSCTEHFYESLKLLLEFVTTAYFTRESVQKEQGIIAQEIGMNLDNPDTRIFENLMAAMYCSHPIRVPILGTEASIAKITPEILEACHRAFYRPENMLLCVMGDVDPQQVCQIAEQFFLQKEDAKITAVGQWQEEMTCGQAQITEKMEVAMPLFHLGFKCEPTEKGPLGARQEAVGEMAAEWLFGESSQLYMQLYEQELVDGSFVGGFETINDMALLSCTGDSRDPEAVRGAIMEQAQRLIREGLEDDQFQRMKRSIMGRRVRELDSFDSTVFRLCSYYFSGFDYFDFPQIIRSVEKEELTAFLQRVVTPERAVLSVIYPCKEETEI